MKVAEAPFDFYLEFNITDEIINRKYWVKRSSRTM